MENEKAIRNGFLNAFPDLIESGLSKREFIASQVLSGLVSRGESGHVGEFAEVAVSAADALLDELQKTKNNTIKTK